MRRHLLAGAVLATGAFALAAQGTFVPTDAAWNDEEWVGAASATVDCEDPVEKLVAGTARGRVLSGSLLSLDLDTLAALDGVVATTDGEVSSATPAQAEPVAGLEDAWADPLDLTLLSLLGLGTAGITLPLDTPVGVVGQFAQADPEGAFVGAAGVVNDSGLLELTPDAGGYPDLASLDLKTLVSSLSPTLASIVAPVANLSLDVGAVGSRVSTPDACGTAFSDSVPVREYVAAGLDLEIESELVSGLVTTVEGILDDLEGTVAALAGDASLLADLESGITALLKGLLSTLGIGDFELGLTLGLNLDAVRDLLVEPVADSGGVLVVRPADGTITVDLAALLAETYPGQYSDGLNGLDPNSSLLADPAILTTLETALVDALAQWVTGLEDALDDALDLLQVNLTAVVDVSPVGLPLLKLELGVNGALGDMLDGGVPASARLTLLGAPLNVLSALIAGLQAGLGLTVGTIVHAALPTVGSLLGGLADLTGAIVSLVATLYSGLFLDGVVEVTVNAQNAPLTGDAGPNEWSGLPAGRYDVAAIRVGVLDVLSQLGIYVHLARSSVGPLCLVATGDC